MIKKGKKIKMKEKYPRKYIKIQQYNYKVHI